ncbi:MAG: BlaI/MecI/CopY family transcriptional regulator [Defluviitaleaceae bacterium]|nr:BlaI/MecI/CopY family transcriptional regulator [Defluviitaleaceae bacterium]
MDIKLYDSELKVMDVIWREGEISAKNIREILGGEIGWNKNTTYTVIKKCVEKGLVERIEPNFVCRALVSRDEVRAFELDELINRMYDGSSDMLFAALLGRKDIPAETIERLKELIEGGL